MAAGSDAAVSAILAAVPWAELALADASGPAGNTVASDLAALARSSNLETRCDAAGNLYCSLSNQGVAGQVTPYAAGVLVQMLREDLCRDREVVYDVLQAILECQAWNVKSHDEGESLIVETRRQIVSGLEVYLADVDRLDPQHHQSLFHFLNELVAHYSVILDRVRSAMSSADPHSSEALSDAYKDILEHVQNTVGIRQAVFAVKVTDQVPFGVSA